VLWPSTLLLPLKKKCFLSAQSYVNVHETKNITMIL
jgi:hypothetical protein